MNLRSVVDSSFLYSAFQLEILRYLCLLFDRIILVPSVLSECVRFQSQLLQLKCVEKVILTDIEKREVDKLHTEFTERFPGKHLGEIECLVVENSRAEEIVISDNFAPWFLQKKHSKYDKVKIHRGWWVVGRLIEIKKLDIGFLEKLTGRYPRKALDKLRRLFQNESS